MIFVKNKKKYKLVGLYERAPNVLGLHVLKIRVVELSVRCRQTTHSFLDFGQGRVRDSVLSQSPSQSQSSSAIHARGMQTTQDPSTHYNRVILDGCVSTQPSKQQQVGVSPSHSPSPAWKRQSESERVLSNLSKILEIRNSPSLPPSLPSSLPRDHPVLSCMHSTQS